MLQNNPELKSQIDQLWNKFWAGGYENQFNSGEWCILFYHAFLMIMDSFTKKMICGI
ncbi:MAG: hypothetical protein KAI40_06155 [Desulfobacterales bacterium]|nr:hypothetical protein [Desulfobacterales bacterium]